MTARLRGMPRFRVDLRSDTVSKPSDAMRAAMAAAEVGDAWYGDDPTVNRLQERAAELTGMEAALYVATGTMANQIGLRLHVTGQGHLVACERSAHVATTEVITSATQAGIAYRTGSDHPHGYMTATLAERLLEPDPYFDVEVIDLLTVENTVGAYGAPSCRPMSSAPFASSPMLPVCRSTSTGHGSGTRSRRPVRTSRRGPARWTR